MKPPTVHLYKSYHYKIFEVFELDILYVGHCTDLRNPLGFQKGPFFMHVALQPHSVEI